MSKRVLLFSVIMIFFVGLIGCKEEVPPEPSKFSLHEKVCYIDDANLTGRIIGNTFISGGKRYYYVRWLVPSHYSPALGGKIRSSVFTHKYHLAWELKSLKKEGIQ